MIKKRKIYFLLIIIFIDTIGNGMIFPFVSTVFLYKNVFFSINDNLKNLYYFLNLIIYSLGIFISPILLGILSDIYEKKKILILSTIVEILSLIILGYSLNISLFYLFFLGRFLYSLTHGSSTIIQSFIINLSEKKKISNYISLITFFSYIGFIIGAIINKLFFIKIKSLLFNKNSIIFYFSSVLNFINIIILYVFFTQKDKSKKKNDFSIKKIRIIFIYIYRNKNIYLILKSFFFLDIGYFIYYNYIPLFFKSEFHFTQNNIINLIILLNILYGISSLIIVKILSIFLSLKNTIFFALINMTFGMFFSLFNNIYMQFLSLILFGLFESIVYIGLLSLVSKNIDKKYQGFMLGITSALTSIAFFIISILLGLLHKLNIYIPLYIALISNILSLIFVKLFYNKLTLPK